MDCSLETPAFAFVLHKGTRHISVFVDSARLQRT